MAERIMAARLAGTNVRVTSAGTGALVGCDMEPEIRSRLIGFDGTDLRPHYARQLTLAMIRDADLILALAQQHMTWVLEEEPRALRKVFTLRELASIVGQIGGSVGMKDGVRDLALEVDRAADCRSSLLIGPSGDQLDVVDPFKQSAAVYDQMSQDLGPAALAVAGFLREESIP
jgi:protein-tyrosine phosphatase